MSGRLIYFMGPSGAGKDTVLEHVVRRMGNRAFLAPRVVTRMHTGEREAALPVSADDFAKMEAAGLLALSWRANGLAYGVLRHVDDHLAAGQDVFVNGSRAYLPVAQERYRDLIPVLIQVQPHLLRERLQMRGRETEAQISARLARNAQFADLHGQLASPMLCVDNSGDAEAAAQDLYQRLQDWRHAG